MDWVELGWKSLNAPLLLAPLCDANKENESSLMIIIPFHNITLPRTIFDPNIFIRSLDNGQRRRLPEEPFLNY